MRIYLENIHLCTLRANENYQLSTTGNKMKIILTRLERQPCQEIKNNNQCRMVILGAKLAQKRYTNLEQIFENHPKHNQCKVFDLK